MIFELKLCCVSARILFVIRLLLQSHHLCMHVVGVGTIPPSCRDRDLPPLSSSSCPPRPHLARAWPEELLCGLTPITKVYRSGGDRIPVARPLDCSQNCDEQWLIMRSVFLRPHTQPRQPLVTTRKTCLPFTERAHGTTERGAIFTPLAPLLTGHCHPLRSGRRARRGAVGSAVVYPG